MSYYCPIITHEHDSFKLYVSTSINEYIVGPYHFSRDNFNIKDEPDFLMLFDLPEDIVVLFNETPIPSSSFDYFNPLILNNRIIKKVEFYKINSTKPITTFECSCLIPGSPKSIINDIMHTVVSYPGGFTIDYKSITAHRSPYEKQICDILTATPRVIPPILRPTQVSRTSIITNPSQALLQLMGIYYGSDSPDHSNSHEDIEESTFNQSSAEPENGQLF